MSTPRPVPRRRFIRLAAIASAGALVAACGGGAGGGPDTVKIGSLHPLSGGLQFEGTEAHQGVLTAVDEINAAGGIASMGGAQVEVVSEDHGGDVDRGSAQATRMIQQDVTAILGTMSSGVGLAIQPISERGRIPFMVSAAADPELTARGLAYTFRAHPHVGMSVQGAVDGLKGLSTAAGRPVRSVAHLRLEISAYEAVSDLLAEQLPAAGMELVTVASAPLDSTDFSTQVSQIKAAKPDVVVISALLAQSLEIVATMDAQAFRPPFTVGIAAGFTHPGFAEQLPELGDNIGDVTYWYDPQSAVWESFAARYEQRFGSVPTTHAAQGYQSAMVVLDAVQRSGSTDGPAVRDALAATSLEQHLLPQEGPLRFGPDGQNPDVQSPLTQLVDGSPQVVWPPEFQVAEPVFPDTLATY